MPRKPLILPPRRELLRIFDYDPKRGVLIRRWRRELPKWINGRFAGKISGSVSITGHLIVNIGYQRYLAHRVIWKILYGTEPEEVDHKNLNPADNRKSNLRDSTHSENCCNCRGRKISTRHLPKGVYCDLQGRIYSRITARKKHYYLGTFMTVEGAKSAYDKASKCLHGKFSRTQ